MKFSKRLSAIILALIMGLSGAAVYANEAEEIHKPTNTLSQHSDSSRIFVTESFRQMEVDGLIFDVREEVHLDLSRNGQQDPFTFTSVSFAGDINTDRAEVIRALDKLGNELAGGNVIAPRSWGWLSDSRSQRHGDGTFEVTFSDTTSVDAGFWEVRAFYDGRSSAMWTGFNPWTIDIMELNDFVTFNGLAVSVSVGTSGGSVSGSGTSRTVEMRSQRNDAWLIQNFYTNLQASTNVALTSVEKRTEGVFRTGARNFFVNTHASSRW
ncbi:MAG: hypothetical protein FWB80_12520 [Defluviitaleaceae bacterium]|nr:hypothetical protein [Defluviitaleaceae bacterium]